MAAGEPEAIGERVRRARGAAGLTQEELAARAGLSVRGLSDLERGIIRSPHPDTVRRLAAALGLGPAERAALYTARQGTRPASAPAGGGLVRPEPPAGRDALPLALTSFVGREGELADLRALLGDGRCRLLTLTGTGGVGKSRLALRAAQEAGDVFPDGAWLVELAALREPALVPQAVAVSLGVQEQPGRALEQTLEEALGGRRLLLLDNCEHLLTAVAPLAERLLRAGPHLRILATSREPLGLPGEVVWRVPPLRLPPPDEETPVARLGEAEAVRLFAERAMAARPDFALDEHNAADVAEICRRLDGLPLAIELAAVRVRALQPAEIALRLDDRFHLLTAGVRTAPPRQQTLRATLDWSYDLLGARERRLFDRLAVFAGGCTLAAAEAVCADEAPDGLERAAVLDLLARLVDRSLVLARGGGDGRETRYTLLETLRAYASERLEGRGEAEERHRRYAAWALGLAEAAERACHGPDEGAWLRRVEDERANIRAALAWAIDRDGETALRLAGGLAWFWFAGPARSWAEGRDWLERALALPAAPTSARAKALAAAALLAIFQGDAGAARARLEESAALAQQLGDDGAALTARGHRVLLHAFAGDFAAAIPLAVETLALARRLDHAWFAGRMLSIQARFAMGRGDYAAAATLLGEGVALARRAGDAWSLAMALEELGDVERSRGAATLARERYEESLALRAGQPDGGWSPSLLHNLGYVAIAEGDLGAAATRFAQALVEFRRHGERRGVIECLVGLGAVAAAEGRAGDAARRFGAAEAALEALGSKLWPSNRADYERSIAAIRIQLEDQAFADAWSSGRCMALEAAIADALDGAPQRELAAPLAGER